MARDVLLEPHTDLHIALTGTPTLQLRVIDRRLSGDEMRHDLSVVPDGSISYQFLAPHRPVGQRLHQIQGLRPQEI